MFGGTEKRLDMLARERFDKRASDLAVRWLLEKPGVGVALWGASKPSQLDAVAGTMGCSIDPATMLEIEWIIDESVTDPVGPEFLAPRNRAAA